MKKQTIGWITILMVVSLIGIIGVQLIWIENAVNVKNKIFKRSVNEALQQTASRLDNIHNLTFINKVLLNNSSILKKNKTKIGGPLNRDYDFIDSFSVNNKSAIRGKTDADSTNLFAYIQSDTDTLFKLNNGFDVPDSAMRKLLDKFTKRDTSGNNSMYILNDDDTISYNFDSLYFKVLHRFDSLMEINNKRRGMHSFNDAFKLKLLTLKGLTNKLAYEIYTWDMNDVNVNQVREILTKELTNRDIPIDFRFGIFKNKSAVAIPGNSDTLRLLNSEYNVQLYPNNLLQKDLNLAIYFVNRDKFIYRSIGWLLLSSLIFSLIIVLTFALSLYYIVKQKKISEMKADFINNMTHEFKTPIATISVATDSIINENVIRQPDKIRYFTSMIKKENARMNRQVEDILTIARLDKKEFEFNWESLDIHSVIREAIQGISLQVEKRKGEIQVNFSASNPFIISDKMHCVNVFYNLFDNAVKYSIESPFINISTKNTNNGVLVVVADKGIGMSKSVQAKVFEKFYRKTGGNIHNVKGFGLGLSYVNAVVELNGGSIDLKSKPGKGTVFTLFFPFVKNI